MKHHHRVQCRRTSISDQGEKLAVKEDGVGERAGGGSDIGEDNVNVPRG
jgi:hypothetical protein